MIEGSWENRDVAGALVRSPLLIDMQFYAVFDVCVRVCVCISGEPEEAI